MDVRVDDRLTDRLNIASARKRRYPFDDDVIDWSVPMSSDYVYMPEGSSFLHGTAVWERLSDTERSHVTRWEVTQILRNAGHGEHILNQGILAMLWHTDPYEPAWRFMLHEVAEECQHMAMFNEWVRRNDDMRTWSIARGRRGTGAALLAQLVAPRMPELFWVYVLLFEAVGDLVNDAFVRDRSDRLHPTLRQLMRAHRIEEARHIAFAVRWIENGVPKLSPARRWLLQRATERTLLWLSRLPRLMPVAYSEQLAPYLSKEEFEAAVTDPRYTEHVGRHLQPVAEVLIECGALHPQRIAPGPDGRLIRLAGGVDA